MYDPTLSLPREKLQVQGFFYLLHAALWELIMAREWVFVQTCSL